MEMAECELRQRKKDGNEEGNFQEDAGEIKPTEQDQIHIENKPEPVRFIFVLLCRNSQSSNILINFIISLFHYYYY